MIIEDHKRLEETIERAKNTAKAGLRIAVVEEFYAENDSERFNYCPIAALSTLYRPNWIALIGIAYPNGQYFDALTVVDELERSAR